MGKVQNYFVRKDSTVKPSTTFIRGEKKEEVFSLPHYKLKEIILLLYVTQVTE